MSGLIKLFGCPWAKAPTVWLSAATTGTLASDAVCRLGVARVEDGKVVARKSWLVDPQREIPKEATALHGITNHDVDGKPDLVEVFDDVWLRRMLDGAQPAGWNTPHLRGYMPPGVFDRDWPWLDVMVMVRVHDKAQARAKGQGSLAAAAGRHGTARPSESDPEQSAVAAAELVYALVGFGDLTPAKNMTMGGLLTFQERARSEQWYRWCSYLNERGRR